MVFHFLTVQGSYKGLQIHAFITFKHTLQIHALIVMGLVKKRRKKMTNWYAKEKMWVFSFYSKE